MPQLAISLLGPFRVTLDGTPATGFKSDKVRALLAYLAVEASRPHHREVLAGLLWPDWSDREALGNLRYALANLRQAIGDHAADPPFLHIARDTLQFNAASDYRLDAATFTQLAEGEPARPATVDQLRQAVTLYQGHFLEGFALSDCPAFEEWALFTRERLTRQMVSALHHLTARYAQRGDFAQAQTCAWRQVELAPWDEAAHQQLMRVLALAGQRSAALAQYEACRRLLAEELGVEPAQETTQLYEQIRSGALTGQRPLPTAPPVVVVSPPPPPFALAEPDQVETPLFVAREQELARLDGFLAQALAGQGRVAFVTGEAGGGKTALLHAFARRAQAAHSACAVVIGNCSAYTGIGDPYLPWREILELLSGGIAAKWSVGAITRATAERLWQLGPATVQALLESGPDLVDTFIPAAVLRERATIFAPELHQAQWQSHLEALAARKPVSGFDPFGPQQRDLFEQYTRVLHALAQRAPLLLALDDLQWADLGSISLLFHLGRRLAGSRILVVGAYRPEEVALGRGGERHPLERVVNELRRQFGEILVHLGQAESRAFMEALLDSEPNRLDNAFRQMLYQQTGGHPLFTIELLRGLQERGDLQRDAQGRWVAGAALDWETMPARVEAVIAERISRLARPLRGLLRVACVEGELFTAEAAARISGTDEQEMLRRLSGELDRVHRLVRAHSIVRVNGQRLSRYRFQHILFQKYLYGSMDQVERANLHEQVGLALEQLYSAPEQAETISVQLALHFWKAGLTEKALRYLQEAGERAMRLSAYESRAHLNRALDLLMTLPDSPKRAEQELALQLALGKAWMNEIPVAEWEKTITRARALCQELGKTAELIRALGELSIFYYVRAEHQKGRELAEETLCLAQQGSDPLLLALGHWHLGFVTFSMGEYPTASAHLAQVIAFYDPQEHHQRFVTLRGSDTGTSALAYDACCRWCLGYPEQALKRSQETLALGHALQQPFSLADILCFGGAMFNSMRRDGPALAENAVELVDLSRKMSYASWLGAGMRYQGEALAMQGKLEAGIAHMREGIAVMETVGARCHIVGTLCILAEAQARAGRVAEALETLAEGLARVEESGERHWQAELYRLSGELLLAQGAEAEGEASLRRALETARRQSGKAWELRAALSLSRLWQSQGRPAAARELLGAVYDWFTEGFDTADLRAAKALLDELSAA
jgi:DNA-binding SARP family transcriptional activator/predicted ATPase